MAVINTGSSQFNPQGSLTDYPQPPEYNNNFGPDFGIPELEQQRQLQAFMERYQANRQNEQARRDQFTGISPQNGPMGTLNTNPLTSNPLFSHSNPFYDSVISAILNEQGQQVGTVPLDNKQFATPDMANALLQYYANQGFKGGSLNTAKYSGPTAPSQAELGIQFGNSPIINAGLEYQRLQNANGYSQPYLNAQFQDTLQPGSSGWSNYANGGQGAMNSADAERAYAGNPNFDPNANAMGQAWKTAETGLNYFPRATQNNSYGIGGPGGIMNSGNNMFNTGAYSANSPNSYSSYSTPSTQPGMRSYAGNTGMSGYASAMNRRPVHFGSSGMNFRGQRF